MQIETDQTQQRQETLEDVHGTFSGSVETESAETDRVVRTDDDPLYVISVAAKLVGMPAWTLRVLDEQGIVTPKRTEKNRRLYSDRDLIRLNRVRILTEEQGVNMNGVRLILKLEEEKDLPKGE